MAEEDSEEGYKIREGTSEAGDGLIVVVVVITGSGGQGGGDGRA